MSLQFFGNKNEGEKGKNGESKVNQNLFYHFRNFLRSGFSSLTLGQSNCLLSTYTFPQVYVLRMFGNHIDKSLLNNFLKEKIGVILSKANEKKDLDLVKSVFRKDKN